MPDLTVRSARHEDWGFLRAMLYEAAHWRPGEPRPPMQEALASPEVGRYLEGWGREGDRGLVAAAGGQHLGAAWYRLFPAEAPGYGFIDARTPELTVGVAPRHRRKGVGRALLAALLLQARLDDLPALSLSVEHDNPAKGLYEQLGFGSVRQIGDARTMVARL